MESPFRCGLASAPAAFGTVVSLVRAHDAVTAGSLTA
jgi:hypothetical protein